MGSATLLLLGLLGAGSVAIGGIFSERYVDQVARDARRRVFIVGFPRTVTQQQVEAFLATLAGLASPRLGLAGRDGAVLEVMGTRGSVTHRLRLPAGAADYFVAQLRAAVHGATVKELAYLEGLELKRINAREHMRKILALAEIHGKQALCRALDDGLELQAFSSEYIANILAARRRISPEPAALQLTRRMDLLDLEMPEPDLSIYDRDLGDD